MPLFLIATLYFLTPLLANTTWQQVLTEINQPEPKINLARGILLIDKLIQPTVNVNDHLRIINSLKQHLYDTAKNQGVSPQLRHLRYVLHGNNPHQLSPYSYNHHVTSINILAEKVKTALLSHYLMTQRGTCISMPLLVMILSQDTPMALHISRQADHMFIGFDHLSSVYFEATSNQIHTKERRMAWLGLNTQTHNPRPLNASQILVHYLHLYGLHLLSLEKFAQARTVFRYIAKKNRHDTNHLTNLKAVYGSMYLKSGKPVYRQLYNHYRHKAARVSQ